MGIGWCLFEKVVIRTICVIEEASQCEAVGLLL